MTREELRDIMVYSGEIERMKPSDNWIIAFDLYKEATGDKEVTMSCGSCFRKVKQWLTR